MIRAWAWAWPCRPVQMTGLFGYALVNCNGDPPAWAHATSKNRVMCFTFAKPVWSSTSELIGRQPHAFGLVSHSPKQLGPWLRDSRTSRAIRHQKNLPVLVRHNKTGVAGRQFKPSTRILSIGEPKIVRSLQVGSHCGPESAS